MLAEKILPRKNLIKILRNTKFCLLSLIFNSVASGSHQSRAPYLFIFFSDLVFEKRKIVANFVLDYNQINTTIP